MPEKIKPPVTPIIICFQLFIFTFSLLFSHSGYLLIFLSSVHRSHSLFLFCSNSLVITQQALGFQREMYSITRGSKQVEIFFSYSTRWMNSCNHQSLPSRQRFCHNSQSSWCLIVSLFIKNSSLPNVMSTNAFKFMIITLEWHTNLLFCVLKEVINNLSLKCHDITISSYFVSFVNIG